MAAGCRAGGHQEGLRLAIEQYEAAEKLDPKSVDIRNSLGGALLRTGKPAEAETAFREALALQPTGAAAAVKRTKDCYRRCWRRKKTTRQRRNWALISLRILTTRPCELERASLLVDAGKYEDALAELDKAAAAGPESLARVETSRADLFSEETV